MNLSRILKLAAMLGILVALPDHYGFYSILVYTQAHSPPVLARVSLGCVQGLELSQEHPSLLSCHRLQVDMLVPERPRAVSSGRRALLRAK